MTSTNSELLKSKICRPLGPWMHHAAFHTKHGNPSCQFWMRLHGFADCIIMAALSHQASPVSLAEGGQGSSGQHSSGPLITGHVALHLLSLWGKGWLKTFERYETVEAARSLSQCVVHALLYLRQN